MRNLTKEEFIRVIDVVNKMQSLNEDNLKINLEFLRERHTLDDMLSVETEYYIYNDDCKWVCVNECDVIKLSEFSILDRMTGKMLILIPLFNFEDEFEELIKMIKIATFRYSSLFEQLQGDEDED